MNSLRLIRVAIRYFPAQSTRRIAEPLAELYSKADPRSAGYWTISWQIYLRSIQAVVSTDRIRNPATKRARVFKDD
jgi:hypothetical protein